jgi:hypothetical protein
MIKSWLTHGLVRKSKTGQMVAPMTRTLGETIEGEGSVANLAGGGIPGLWTPVG